MENGNAIKSETGQGSDGPQQRVVAGVKLCQQDCSRCAVRVFMDADRSNPVLKQRAEHQFVAGITGVPTELLRLQRTKSQRRADLAESTEDVLGCHRLNGHAQDVYDRVAGAHRSLQLPVHPTIAMLLQQQSVASSK